MLIILDDNLKSTKILRLPLLSTKISLKVRLWWLGAVLQYPHTCKGLLSSSNKKYM